ncbi:MAG: DUF2252 family protein [Burkholderiales bacterium]|nr:DUF2252 family protein [Burkholderiales bacterium]
MDLVNEIRSWNAGREPERLRMKYQAMHGDAFRFLRGTAHLFYGRVPAAGIFKSAPLAWACGDLHLENFGSYKGDNRLAYFDLNDFDEAALAPATWDLVRMLTSIRIAADTYGATAAQAQASCNAYLDAYAAALVAGKAYWIERETAEGVVRTLLDDVRHRERSAFLNRRTTLKGRKRKLVVDGRHALAATPGQRAAVTDFIDAYAATQNHGRFFRVIDVARRIAGTGSLGLDRYVILVEGKGSPDANYLIDLKEAAPSALARWTGVKQPRWKTEAERVVTVQRRMQAVSMAFLRPMMMGDKSYILRGLQPTEDRIAIDHPAVVAGEFERAVATMGRLTAWAQLRSAGRGGADSADDLIEWGGKRKWKSRLLEVSEHCAEACRADSKAYDTAYDAGAFDV